MSRSDRTRRSEEFCYWCSDYGIWFTLRVLHRNLSPILFKDFMIDLMKQGDAKTVNFQEMREESDYKQTPGKPDKRAEELELA